MCLKSRSGACWTWCIPKNPPFCTKPPPVRYQKTPRFVPNTPPNVPPPVCTRKRPPTPHPHKTNMQQNHPFYQKTTWLPHICYTCGPLCTKKTTWLPPFVLKNPRIGCLGIPSFPPLATTCRSAIRSVCFGGETFHCSRLLPFLCCTPPPPSAAPTCAYLCHISNPKTASNMHEKQPRKRPTKTRRNVLKNPRCVLETP